MKLRKFAAVLLAALLMLTICAAPIFADEDSSAVSSSSETVESSATESSAVEESSATDSSAVDSSATADTTETEDKELNWDAIIAGGIVLLALIVLAVIYFVSPKFHEKVNKFGRDYKSELKKIVWSPLRDVKKNTIVVLVLSIFFVILIGIMDLAFSGGINALKPVLESLYAKMAG